ncbi:TetR/AcrR family transcriptional regulator [Virgisporangium ochraceum]|jgi:AcrR family transcriptional regulator|uniref:TetR family transcriptional regulator n=2 Tax=Virgisporangium ochraceum TaxID=65505 RepID=A0A8J3ZS15_9ACTN|nr:TetR family transcriptional regulator [Virgisporangium ochraceum]
MWYMGEARDALLDAAVEYAAHHGIADVSLRQLAAALGTSHRMLVYHFGSKEGLLVAVVREVEARQRAFLADLDGSLPPVEMGQRLWERLSDPAMWPYEKLFFEVYSQALRSRPHTAAMLEGVVESWVAPIADLNVRNGVPPGDARATARLSVAVTRGLLLDLLATGDQDGVREAMDRFLALYLNAYGGSVSE